MVNAFDAHLMIPIVVKSKSEDVTQFPQHSMPVSNFSDPMTSSFERKFNNAWVSIKKENSYRIFFQNRI